MENTITFCVILDMSVSNLFKYLTFTKIREIGIVAM